MRILYSYYALDEASVCLTASNSSGLIGAYDEIGCSTLRLDKINAYEMNLLYNYPNPFNSFTLIHYTIPIAEFVKITVYDIVGCEIKTLVNYIQNAGYKSVQWDATNNQGQSVSAGVYLYTIEAGDFRQTKKMVLLK